MQVPHAYANTNLQITDDLPELIAYSTDRTQNVDLSISGNEHRTQIHFYPP